MQLFKTIIALLILLVAFGKVHAQSDFSRSFWLNETNTPVKVNDMAEDDKGYIWLATEEGLYRFNGRSFIHIPDSINKPATAVCVANNQVWVGYNNGKLGLVDGDLLRTFNVNNGPHSSITSISSGSGKVVWLTTEDEGIFLLVGSTSLPYNTAKGLSDNFVYMLSELPGNRIIAATDKGINEVMADKKKLSVQTFTTAQDLPDNIVRVIKPIPKTTFYMIGTQQGGLALYCHKSRTVWKPQTDENWTYGQVNDILPVNEKKAWVATESGYMLEVTINNKGEKLDIKSYHFPDKKLKKMVLGKSGILWCATNENLLLVALEYMEYISLPAPYNMGAVRAMVFDEKNTMWFSQGKTLYRCNAGDKTAQVIKMNDMQADITSLFADEQGRIWIGTLGKGLWYREANGSLRAVAGIANLVGQSILDVTGTYDRLWVSSLNGVAELSYPGDYTGEMLLIKLHNKHSGVGSDYVYQLYPDRKGRIWMATDGAGICMYDGARYTHWNTAGIKSKVAYSVAEDGLGNIWASTLGNGLYKYDDSVWTQLTTAQGLQDINVSVIAPNATGQVAVVNSKGIDVWYPQSEQFRNYKLPIFGKDSISNTLKLYANDMQGNIYLPIEGGVLKYKNIYADYDIRPHVNISSVSVFFNPVPMGTYAFKANQNHIGFRYEGINFANPDRLHYRYKLVGYNETWTVTNDETVTFPQLPDGEYTFHIQASLNNTFSEKGASVYHFSVDKPFWRRVWFIGIVALLLAGIAYTYVYVREQNIRKLSSLQKERMMFEYEHLKSQVNPHFLFNSLNTLTNLIDEDSAAAMEYTSRLSDLYRNMLSYRDKDLISLAEEWEILENYMYIQQTRFDKALRLVSDVPERLKRTKRIVPLALQMLVENAIKHNIVSFKTPLTIYITANEESISIHNHLQPKISKEKGAGLGLINIRKRYSLLSKKNINFGVEHNEYVVTLPLL